MAEVLNGGCACGAVRYAAKGKVHFAFHCQCRDCQLNTGSGHATSFATDKSGFEVNGMPRQWDRETKSGAVVSKYFCPECGTPVYGISSRYPNNRMVMAGTLDDPALLTPDRIFFAETAQPWDHQSVEASA